MKPISDIMQRIRSALALSAPLAAAWAALAVSAITTALPAATALNDIPGTNTIYTAGEVDELLDAKDRAYSKRVYLGGDIPFYQGSSWANAFMVTNGNSLSSNALVNGCWFYLADDQQRVPQHWAYDSASGEYVCAKHDSDYIILTGPCRDESGNRIMFWGRELTATWGYDTVIGEYVNVEFPFACTDGSVRARRRRAGDFQWTGAPVPQMVSSDGVILNGDLSVWRRSRTPLEDATVFGVSPSEVHLSDSGMPATNLHLRVSYPESLLFMPYWPSEPDDYDFTAPFEMYSDDLATAWYNRPVQDAFHQALSVNTVSYLYNPHYGTTDEMDYGLYPQYAPVGAIVSETGSKNGVKFGVTTNYVGRVALTNDLANIPSLNDGAMRMTADGRVWRIVTTWLFEDPDKNLSLTFTHDEDNRETDLNWVNGASSLRFFAKGEDDSPAAVWSIDLHGNGYCDGVNCDDASNYGLWLNGMPADPAAEKVYAIYADDANRLTATNRHTVTFTRQTSLREVSAAEYPAIAALTNARPLVLGGVATNGAWMAVGTGAVADGEDAFALGGIATGAAAHAIGGANATGESATAVYGDASGDYALAIGGIAAGSCAIGIGNLQFGAVGDYSIAIGGDVDGTNSVQLGTGGLVYGHDSVLIGSDGNLVGTNSVGIGTGVYVVSNGVFGIPYVPANFLFNAKADATPKSLQAYLDERVAWSDFTNAVLAVGMNVDTNVVASINEMLEADAELPTTGVATVGGLLAALAAGLAALKKKTANAVKASVNGDTLTIESI